VLVTSSLCFLAMALLGSLPGQDAKGLAIRAGKALIVPPEGKQVINDAIILVKGGKIERVGPAATTEIPEGYAVEDARDSWVMPGMIDLHCHTASTNFFVNDLNDMVYLANPGLRASTSIVPANRNLRQQVAGGLTSVLYIPGSGTNMGGQGVLLKTGLDEYERMEIRNPGSLKLAQAGNPERWTITVSRSLMNWNTRNTFRRGLNYAKRWVAHEEGKGPKPERNPQWDVFRDLLSGATQVSTHTQIYQVVLMTITMVRQELGLDVYIDHGSFDGWRTGALAQAAGVPAILGPRAISPHIFVEYRPGMFIANDNDGAVFGMAAKYQEQGHTMIGFNTDSPVIPGEELPLQAGMAVRYGLDGNEPLTLKQIGARIGLTRERVRQIEIESLRKLNQRLNSDRPLAAIRARESVRQRRSA